uniref:Uncharacterized protein n=1 Tax=Anolis carolinensis TaxID=28377 RepID=A0A803SUE4_ANOCA
LNQIDKKYSKQCWRGCQENGTYIHMWWSCKYVQKFWENVFKEIKGITKTEIIGTPEIMSKQCYPCTMNLGIKSPMLKLGI